MIAHDAFEQDVRAVGFAQDARDKFLRIDRVFR
jgi:hypothetical protein